MNQSPWKEKFLPVILLLTLGGLWEGAVRLWDFPAYILPGPVRIFHAMLDRAEILVVHSLVTLSEIAVGFLVAFIVGVLLALALQSSRILERALLPLLIASQTIPVFAIAPLLILWFGYGMGSKIVMTAIIVFFPIVINTFEGLKAADPDLLSLLRIMEASPWQILWKVRIPQALPFIFSGIKIGVAVSVIGAVIGEWVGARKGLGYLMIHANAQLEVDLVFASIFCLSLMGVGLYGFVEVLERACIPWSWEGQKKGEASS